MTKGEIDKLLEAENQEVIDAHIDIVSIQKDKTSLLKLGIPWADDILEFSGYNNSVRC